MRHILIFLFALTHLASAQVTMYVRSSDGSDADDGSTWALAKATISGALTDVDTVAGSTVYVSDNYAQTPATDVSLPSAGTATARIRILCVDDAGDPEPPTALATTASIICTGTSSDITFTGFGYCYGVQFTAGNASSCVINWTNTAAMHWKMENCYFRLNTTSTTAALNLGSSSTSSTIGSVDFVNCTVRFGNASQRFYIRVPFRWSYTDNAIDAAGTVPTTLFSTGSGNNGFVECNGVDFSAMGSGNTFVNLASAAFTPVRLINCQKGASSTLATGTPIGQSGHRIEAFNFDTGDTNYHYASSAFEGDVTTETTIVRTSGASNGTTTQSHKMVCSIYTALDAPLRSPPILFWNDTVGSVSVEVPVLTDNVTLDDDEAWLEVEYLGTSNQSLSVVGSDSAAGLLATPAAQPTDAVSTWTTTGLTTPVKQTLAKTVTAAEKGVMAVRVCLAARQGAPNTAITMYYDPKVLSDTGRQYLTPSGFLNEGPATGGGAAEHSSTFVQ